MRKGKSSFKGFNKNSREISIKNIRGMNIYLDQSGQTVFHDKLTKVSYIIEDKNQRSFYFFQNRLIIVFLAMILGVDFIYNWTIGIAIGVALLIIAELAFRIWYLPKLKTLDTFVPYKKASVLNGIIQDHNIQKTITKLILYAAFSVLIVINAFTQKMELPLLLLSIVISIISFYYCIIHAIGMKKILDKKQV